MSDQLRTIRLYGYLGAQFGRVHRLAVASCAEAVQALCVLLPGFERELMTSKDRGVGYACFLGRRNLADDQLCDLAGQEDIRIAPMVQGAKRGGLFTLVLGAALFFAAPYLVNPATAGLLGEGGAMVFGAGWAAWASC
jgi:predicted phage tail protein